jgi:DNA-binding CsgD family transcriptional regulator
MALFGRDKEITRIRALLGCPRESALIVTGGRGCGKSSLLAEIPQLHGHRTVLLRVNPSESTWRFSGLTALLNGIDDPALAPLVDHVASSPPGNLDAADLSIMLLSTLRQWSGHRTVVAIDDAADLDPASQTVLGFLARRLAGTGLVLIASMKEEAPDSPFARLASLRLENLSISETVRMLESRTPGQCSKATLHAVAAATQGNPLASIELCNQLTERQLHGKCALPFPLHWNGSVEVELAASISALSPCARQALDHLSLSYRSNIGLLKEMPGDLWAGVQEIVSAGVAVRSGSSVRIQNPMLRAHIFSTMPPGERAAHHDALAAAAETVDRHAWPWHLSYTAAARSDTSFSLLREAVELVRAEEIPSAVEYIERALTINPWEAETAARLGTVAEVLFSRGEFVYAKRYVDWAQRITKDRALTLRLTGIDFQMEMMQGKSVRPSIMMRLIKEFGRHDPRLSASLLSIGALHLTERWQLGDSEQLLDLAEQFRRDASGEALAVNRRARLLTDAAKGTVERISRASDVGNSFPAPLLLKGRAMTYAENYDGARDHFAMVRSFSAASDVNWREMALHFAADNEIRAGNIRRAVALIDEIVGAPASQQYQRGMRHYFLLWRAHSVGDAVEAQARLSEAQEFVGSDASPQVAAQLFACQGHFALMRGDLEEACTLLSRAAEIGMDFGNPALLRCETDLVEAMVRSGRRREAARALTGMESRSVGLNSPWLRQAVSRSRALVAEGDHSLELFNQALDSWRQDGSLFERARTLLCYAERLETSGRTRDAKNARLRARALFEEVGAASWTRQVDALLLGNHLPDASDIRSPALLLLSAQERELVHLVARGRRNKEIAATLFVSVRTVEVRLTAIYRKLGVQSRSQLTCLVSAREPVEAPSREASPIAV